MNNKDKELFEKEISKLSAQDIKKVLQEKDDVLETANIESQKREITPLATQNLNSKYEHKRKRTIDNLVKKEKLRKAKLNRNKGTVFGTHNKRYFIVNVNNAKGKKVEIVKEVSHPVPRHYYKGDKRKLVEKEISRKIHTAKEDSLI